MKIEVVHRSKESVDPLPVPSWVDNPEAIAPCPCGYAPDDDVFIVQGEKLSRWVHPECLSLLRHDMTPEEVEEMNRWKRENLDED